MVLVSKKSCSVLITVVATLIAVLLFVPGFFSYSYVLTSIGTSSGIKAGSYFELMEGASDALALLPVLIVGTLVASIVIVWRRYKKRKPDANVALICVGGALILLCIGAFIGKDGYDSSWSDTMISTGLTLGFRYTFLSFGFMFAVEVFLFALLCGLLLFQKRCVDKRLIASENKSKIDSSVEELLTLKVMMDKGEISQEEFTARKKQIMGL